MGLLAGPLGVVLLFLFLPPPSPKTWTHTHTLMHTAPTVASQPQERPGLIASEVGRGDTGSVFCRCEVPGAPHPPGGKEVVGREKKSSRDGVMAKAEQIVQRLLMSQPLQEETLVSPWVTATTSTFQESGARM